MIPIFRKPQNFVNIWMTKFVLCCTGVHSTGQCECGMFDCESLGPAGPGLPGPGLPWPSTGTQTHKLKMAARLSRLAGDGQAYRAKSEQKLKFYPLILPNQTKDHDKISPFTPVILLCSSDW